MKRLIRLVGMIGAFIVSGCSDESPLGPGTDLVVIRGYLYAGEPVTDIQITSTLPLGSEDNAAPPINDADVYLLKKGRRYDLQPSAGDSGYYHYRGDDLSVEAGDVFEIQVVYYDRVTSGKTVVPPAPDGVAVSPDTFFVSEDNLFPFWRRGTDAAANALLVTWTPDPSSLFYIAIENVGSDPDSIAIDGPTGGMKRRFVSEPTNSSEYPIQLPQLSHYGKHLVRVYRVNQEYADLYESRQQDSRDLNEPLTNVENGLGVFSAFSSDSAYFYVAPLPPSILSVTVTTDKPSYVHEEATSPDFMPTSGLP